LKNIKFSAAFILFDPERKFLDNILSLESKADKLFLVDNSLSRNEWLTDALAADSRFTYLHEGSNKGIAIRLNEVCQLALTEGYQYLLTMDQDSRFDEQSIDQYIRCVESFTGKQEVSMFGINHEMAIALPDCAFNIVNSIITSGSIINLSAYKKIGGFDENLFIDFVDTEYCFRSIQKGYQIIKFPGIFMHHSLGKISAERSIKNLKKTNRSFHSSLRLYYMLRNFLYLNARYKSDFKEELARNKKDLFHRIKNKLIYKSRRIETLRYLLKAWRDFKNNNLGKIN